MEYQPSLRVIWQANQKTAVWGAVSRAVRTISRFERDIRIETPLPFSLAPPLPTVLLGESHPDEQPERLVAYELGIRQQFNDQLSWDLAMFYNQYTKLRVSQEIPQLEADRLVILSTAPPIGEVDTYGFELSMNWQPLDNVLLSPAYTFFDTDIGDGFVSQTSIDTVEKLNPQHQLSLLTEINLPRNTEFNIWLRYVDQLFNPNFGEIDEYWTADINLVHHMNEKLTVSVFAQNLFDSHNMEFGPVATNQLANEVERNVGAQLRWNF